MILPASYRNGFAPRDGSPLYPSLWRGCVGAWAPCLGPTGLTLRDWSGLGNYGTLTNMDPATDWVASQNCFALDIDGSNDHVACSSNSIGNFGTADATISIWVNTADAIANRIFITKREFSGSFQQWSLMQGGVTTGGAGVTGKHISLFWYNGGSLSADTGTQNYRTTNDYIDGRMHHFAATRTNGTVPQIYIDGVSVAVTAIVDGRTNINANGTKPVTIGASTSGGVPVLGQVDDARLYTRALSASEIRLLASRRGIAYEMAPRRRSSSAVQFNRRRRLLLGAS